MLRQSLRYLTVAVVGLLLIAVAAGCTNSDSNPKEQARSSDYEIDQLDAWYEALSDPIWNLGLVQSFYVDESKRQIVFDSYAFRGVREAIEAEISKFNIPRDAVFLNVGCENFRQWPPDPLKPLDESFLHTLEVSMEVPTQATYGKTVPLKLALRNVGDKSVAFLQGRKPYHDFVITTSDGKAVWYWGCAQYRFDVLGIGNLEPGEEKAFVEEWQQVNIRGEPVSPGVYLVHGVLQTGAIEVPRAESHVTEPHRLEVLK